MFAVVLPLLANSCTFWSLWKEFHGSNVKNQMSFAYLAELNCAGYIHWNILFDEESEVWVHLHIPCKWHAVTKSRNDIDIQFMWWNDDLQFTFCFMLKNGPNTCKRFAFRITNYRKWIIGREVILYIEYRVI